MKTQWVAQLQSGDRIDDQFLLSERLVAHKRDGNAFLHVVLSDRSGTLKGVVWDDVERILETNRNGTVVHVRGAVSEYRGVPQAVVTAMAPAPEEQVDPADYLPAARRALDTGEMFARLRKITAGLQDDDLRQLLDAFWDDPEFAGRFQTAPAAKKLHHAYAGGLLEHTLSMAVLADRVARHYRGVDRDLLIAGAMLHDIGKLEELECRLGIEYSDAGRLLSHIVIGCRLIDERIERLESFPVQKGLLLKHMVVSHHGCREFGSPEPPKTIEAFLLHHIDEIDSKVNGIREYMASQPPEEAWTPYHRLWERHFYRGGGRDEGGEEDRARGHGQEAKG